MALNIETDAEWMAVQRLLSDLRKPAAQAPFTAPYGSAERLLDSCESVLKWVAIHADKLPATSDGTPAEHVLDGCLSAIFEHKNPPNAPRERRAEEKP